MEFLMRNEFRTEPKGDTLTQKKKISRHARSLVRNFNKRMTTVRAEIVRKDIVPAPGNAGWEAGFWVTFYDTLTNNEPKTMIFNYPALIKEFSAE